MELVLVLRRLWRRRRLLGAGFIGAVAILVALGGTSPVTAKGGMASTSVALDTPKSELVDAAPAGADSLAWRASILAHLMATETLKKEIALRLGVRIDQVAVVDPAFLQPHVQTDTALAATKVALSVAAPYVLIAFLPTNTIPVVSIQAAALDRAGAGRLAEAAVAVLKAQASTAGSGFRSYVKTGTGVPRRQPFSVEQVAPIRVKLLASTSLPLKPIIASFIAFLVWCAGGLLLTRLLRRLRTGGGATLSATAS